MNIKLTNKIFLLSSLIFFFLLCFPLLKHLQANPNELKGRIFLQTEENGEAWYVSPKDGKKYYLGTPSQAFDIMKDLGIGISSENISKIPIGVMDATSTPDTDGDGLNNALEKALGTSPTKKDTDKDGYNDKKEILAGYNPLNGTKLDLDPEFAKKNAGKIFIETQKNGEAWYINPEDKKRYFLHKPRHAFNIMKKLGSGITNRRLNNIPEGELSKKEQTEESGESEEDRKNKEKEEEKEEEKENTCSSCGSRGAETAKKALDQAAQNIRINNPEKATRFFTEDMQQPVTYTLNFLDKEGRYTLANTLSGSTLSSSNSGAKRKIYKNTVQFYGEKVSLTFRIKEQDGRWFLANL